MIVGTCRGDGVTMRIVRTSLVVAILLVAGTAVADPEVGPSDTPPALKGSNYHLPPSTAGMSIEVGAGVDRVSTTVNPGFNREAYSGQFARFATGTTVRRNFYIGGEIDVGTFSGTTINPNTMGHVDITGGLISSKVVIGVRAMTGIVSGGAELAGGVLRTTLDDTLVYYDLRGLLEARARADVWVSPYFSIGGMVSSALTEQYLTASLQCAFHFDRYDHTR
jgi:hypothetical protein